MTPLFERKPQRWRKNLFDDLPFEKQREAQWRLGRYCEKHRGDSRRGLLAILIGQARRWTMTSPDERSQWGRTMLAKLGGHRVQQMYREQGRIGEKHPSQKAARISVAHRKRAKELKQEAEETERLGLGPKPRTKYLPID